MEIFLDTGMIEEIKKAWDMGIIDGVTTNPSLIAKTGKKQEEVIREIAEIVKGPISAEVIATDYEGMISEAKELKEISKDVVIKLPMTVDGIKACTWCTKNEIKTNVTLVFSVNQAYLAAKAGATYVSPFIGRLDDNGQDGMELIEEMRTTFDNYGYTSKILAASIRNVSHVRQCLLIGADVGTMPLSVVEGLYKHVLTDKGISQFLSDYKKANV